MKHGQHAFSTSWTRTVAMFALVVAITGCTDGAGCTRTPDTGAATSKPATTVDDTSITAFSIPMPGLTTAEERTFFKGRALFRDIWVAPPASTASRDGLGPLFNARSCEGCHVRDGRGRPPVSDGEPLTSMLIRLSIDGAGPTSAPIGDPAYGGQFQPLSISGVSAEGEAYVHYSERPGAFQDGTPYSLRMPHYEFRNLKYGPMHDNVMISPRLAPVMIGLGLLSAIPDKDILARADPDDKDGDGISGRPNYLRESATGPKALGRFGWKANQPTIEQQVAGAFAGDIGITSERFPNEDCTPKQTSCLEAENGGSPELDPTIFESVVFYAKTLAVPSPRNQENQLVKKGRELFDEIGCESCHVSTFVTGDAPDIPVLAHQTIHPYTDLLLHDMGGELADNRPDFGANGQEWRTPPLWGIGMVSTVNEHTFFLHDGRARNLTEAVLWHGGEAEASREAFRGLKIDDRRAIIAFLNSL